MRSATASFALLLGLLASVPSVVRAEEGAVDPRYPFSLDAVGHVGLGTTLTNFGTSQLVFGGALTFGFPVGERRQAIIAAISGTGSAASGEVKYVGLAGGYRIMTYADPFRFRLDLQVATDYVWSATRAYASEKRHQGFGLGGRGGFGLLYHFFPALGVGLQITVAAYAITPHVVVDGGPLIVFNW